MWEENKNVALGVAKENNGCTSDISNSLPPSPGQEEAKGTCWCWAVPGLKALHGVQRTLPLEKPSLCTQNIYLRWHPKSTSTALGAQLPTCTPCRMALTPLARGTGGAAFPAPTETPQTPRANCLEKSCAGGAVEELCKNKILHSACSLGREWNRKYISTHKKAARGLHIFVASLWVRNDHSAKCKAHQWLPSPIYNSHVPNNYDRRLTINSLIFHL